MLKGTAKGEFLSAGVFHCRFNSAPWLITKTFIIESLYAGVGTSVGASLASICAKCTYTISGHIRSQMKFFLFKKLQENEYESATGWSIVPNETESEAKSVNDETGPLMFSSNEWPYYSTYVLFPPEYDEHCLMRIWGVTLSLLLYNRVGRLSVSKTCSVIPA